MRHNKQWRQELKRMYKEEQLATDPSLQLLAQHKEQIDKVPKINIMHLQEWSDEELEQKVVYYVYNRFEKAGKPPKTKNLLEWEREILLNQPLGVQAVYSTNMFESDLLLNGSYWDFFYQNNGAFATDVLKGYQLMGNDRMAEIVEQCIGAYLKLLQSGEIEEMYGVVHSWEIDKDYFISQNSKSFDDLDKEYQQLNGGPDYVLKSNKVQFIRNHPQLLITEE